MKARYPVVLLFGTIGVWVLALFCTPRVAHSIHAATTYSTNSDSDAGVPEYVAPPDMALAGQFGDMFGATNTLFSGLAMLGVALSLWFQVRDRSRSKNPFVTPDISKDPPSFGAATSKDGRIDVPLTVGMSLSNKSDEVALNVRVIVEVKARSHSFRLQEDLDVPLVKGETTLTTLTHVLDGPVVKQLLDDIDAKALPTLNIHLEYSNIMRVKYRSSVSFAITAAPAHISALRVWLSAPQATGETGEMASVGTAPLEARVIKGSWVHGEAE